MGDFAATRPGAPRSPPHPSGRAGYCVGGCYRPLAARRSPIWCILARFSAGRCRFFGDAGSPWVPDRPPVTRIWGKKWAHKLFRPLSPLRSQRRAPDHPHTHACGTGLGAHVAGFRAAGPPPGVWKIRNEGMMACFWPAQCCRPRQLGPNVAKNTKNPENNQKITKNKFFAFFRV